MELLPTEAIEGDTQPQPVEKLHLFTAG